MTMQDLNQKLSIINRVVIHPKYRSIGLGAKLIRETLPLAGTPYIEMVAVMAKYSPFAEKAGMKKIAKQQAAESLEEISKVLTEFGFDLQLLGSERYVKSKIEGLVPEQLNAVRRAFIKNRHLRFRELANSNHQPFGKTSDYVTAIQKADSNKIAKLIKIYATLLQTKVYLFWTAQKE